MGKLPLDIPKGVTLTVGDGHYEVQGPKGTLRERLVSPIRILLEAEGRVARVVCDQDSKQGRALHGLTRRLLGNMVRGVVEPYTRALDIVGVGYQARLKNEKELELQVGFSRPVVVTCPEGIEFEVPQPTHIVVRGCDKQKVGAIAAEIRKVRPPEPYQGKGIRYEGEQIQRKAGKSFVSGGG